MTEAIGPHRMDVVSDLLISYKLMYQADCGINPHDLHVRRQSYKGAPIVHERK